MTSRFSRRTPPSPGPRTAALGASAGLAAAAALAFRSRSRRGQPGADAPREKPAVEEWECSCGQRYRVSGAGRHRIYWLADAETADPVLSDRCPNCDQPLPAHG